MDSPIIAGLLRQLFRRPACQAPRAAAAARNRGPPGAAARGGAAGGVEQRRLMTTRDLATNDGRWQQRSDMFPEDRTAEFETYPMVTAKDLQGHKRRPRKVKMLLRDFIEGESWETHGSLRLGSGLVPKATRKMGCLESC
jgi:hypothetical protein